MAIASRFPHPVAPDLAAREARVRGQAGLVDQLGDELPRSGRLSQTCGRKVARLPSHSRIRPSSPARICASRSASSAKRIGLGVDSSDTSMRVARPFVARQRAESADPRTPRARIRGHVLAQRPRRRRGCRCSRARWPSLVRVTKVAPRCSSQAHVAALHRHRAQAEAVLDGIPRDLEQRAPGVVGAAPRPRRAQTPSSPPRAPCRPAVSPELQAASSLIDSPLLRRPRAARSAPSRRRPPRGRGRWRSRDALERRAVDALAPRRRNDSATGRC